MQVFEDTLIPVIPIEDELLHTPTNPFCWEMVCSCYEDQEHISQVAQWITDGLITREEANDFVAGRTL